MGESGRQCEFIKLSTMEPNYLSTRLRFSLSASTSLSAYYFSGVHLLKNLYLLQFKWVVNCFQISGEWEMQNSEDPAGLLHFFH